MTKLFGTHAQLCANHGQDNKIISSKLTKIAILFR